MSRAPYISSEDSGLLRGALEGRSGRMFLELGAGNGGTLVRLCRAYDVAVGTDVVRPEMRDWSQGADFVLADRASCFRDLVFDLVAFNPPYLPGEGGGDQAVDGGPRLERPLLFLEDALRVVKPEGSVVFLLNQEADVAEFEQACVRHGFRLRPLISRKLFFEVLSVYEAFPEGPRRTSGDSRDGHLETSTASRLHQVPASPS